MAKYKITKTDEYYTYELPAHNECKLTRLHDPADVEGGKLILSRSHFLPAGGGTFLSHHYFLIYLPLFLLEIPLVIPFEKTA